MKFTSISNILLHKNNSTCLTSCKPTQINSHISVHRGTITICCPHVCSLTNIPVLQYSYIDVIIIIISGQRGFGVDLRNHHLEENSPNICNKVVFKTSMFVQSGMCCIIGENEPKAELSLINVEDNKQQCSSAASSHLISCLKPVFCCIFNVRLL